MTTSSLSSCGRAPRRCSKPFTSCDELAGRLRANLQEQMRVELLRYEQTYSRWYADSAVNAEAAPSADAAGAAAAPSGQREEGVNFSGTNNQESVSTKPTFSRPTATTSTS